MGQKETPQKQYVICLANYRYYALGRCMVFRFWLLGASANYPKRFARVEGISDASLASRDCTLSTGEHWSGVSSLVAVRYAVTHTGQL